MYTIPHLDMVAGETLLIWSVSKKILILEFNLILSPLGKHKVLESSITVLRFSIQSVSMGPSNIVHELMF